MKYSKEFLKTFAWELVRTNSGQQAYLNAAKETAVTPKEKIKASQKAQHLIRNKEVIKYLQQIRTEQRISVTEIVSEIASIIRFDPIDMLNDDGTVKAIRDMPETARKMISSIKINELWMGRGDDKEQYGVAKEIKFISKMDAIEKAMKHLGGYKEDNDQRKAVTQIAIFQLPDNGRKDAVILDTVTVGEPIEYVELDKLDAGTNGHTANGPTTVESGTEIEQESRGVRGNLGTRPYRIPDIQNDYGPGD